MGRIIFFGFVLIIIFGSYYMKNKDSVRDDSQEVVNNIDDIKSNDIKKNEESVDNINDKVDTVKTNEVIKNTPKKNNDIKYKSDDLNMVLNSDSSLEEKYKSINNHNVISKKKYKVSGYLNYQDYKINLGAKKAIIDEEGVRIIENYYNKYQETLESIQNESISHRERVYSDFLNYYVDYLGEYIRLEGVFSENNCKIESDLSVCNDVMEMMNNIEDRYKEVVDVLNENIEDINSYEKESADAQVVIMNNIANSVVSDFNKAKEANE